MSKHRSILLLRVFLAFFVVGTFSEGTTGLFWQPPVIFELTPDNLNGVVSQLIFKPQRTNGTDDFTQAWSCPPGDEFGKVLFFNSSNVKNDLDGNGTLGELGIPVVNTTHDNALTMDITFSYKLDGGLGVELIYLGESIWNSSDSTHGQWTNQTVTTPIDGRTNTTALKRRKREANLEEITFVLKRTTSETTNDVFNGTTGTSPTSETTNDVFNGTTGTSPTSDTTDNGTTDTSPTSDPTDNGTTGTSPTSDPTNGAPVIGGYYLANIHISISASAQNATTTPLNTTTTQSPSAHPATTPTPTPEVRTHVHEVFQLSLDDKQAIKDQLCFKPALNLSESESSQAWGIHEDKHFGGNVIFFNLSNADGNEGSLNIPAANLMNFTNDNSSTVNITFSYKLGDGLQVDLVYFDKPIWTVGNSTENMWINKTVSTHFDDGTKSSKPKRRKRDAPGKQITFVLKNNNSTMNGSDMGVFSIGGIHVIQITQIPVKADDTDTDSGFRAMSVVGIAVPCGALVLSIVGVILFKLSTRGKKANEHDTEGSNPPPSENGSDTFYQESTYDRISMHQSTRGFKRD